MRDPSSFHGACAVALALGGALSAACSLDQLMKSGASSGAGDGGAEAGVDAAVSGLGCGVEGESGAQLCRATALCPNVVVDSETFPHCGFRIRGQAVDLVCACGASLCSMGAYTTCQQAVQLLTSQTESQVCVQVNEGRCLASSPSSSSASSGGAKPGCDKQCVSDCGGGAACASVCGC